MSRKATQKQHAFATAYLETGKPSQSYRAAGYACGKMSDNAIAVQANRVLKNPNVALIIEQGRAEARERSQVTIESLTEKLWDDRQLAHTERNPMAAVNATMAVAKLHGLADGQGSQPGKAADIGGQTAISGASKWAAAKAEIEAEWRRKRKEAEEERSEAGTGADGNGAADPTESRH